MTDPTPSTPRRLLMPDLCVVCFEDDCGCPDGKVTEDMRGQKVPTPATPDEADLLETAWGIIANAGGGDWTTQTFEWASAAARWRSDYFAYLDSRRQGDAVAARAGCTHCCENGHVDADDMVTMEMDAYGRGFDDGAEGRTRFASLEDPTVAGLATVRVGDVARRLHEDRRDSHEGVGTSCPRCMDDARRLLGVGDRDGGQR